jgi:hypothetical protein
MPAQNIVGIFHVSPRLITLLKFICAFVKAFNNVRFQVLTAASMKFRFVFCDVLPCKIIVDNYFTWQYMPEDKSEPLTMFLHIVCFEVLI